MLHVCQALFQDLYIYELTEYLSRPLGDNVHFYMSEIILPVSQIRKWRLIRVNYFAPHKSQLRKRDGWGAAVGGVGAPGGRSICHDV